MIRLLNFFLPPKQWNQVDLRKELERKYPSILTPEEKSESLESFYEHRIVMRLVIAHCLRFQMVKLHPQVENLFMQTTNLKDLRLLEMDIAEIQVHVRHMHHLLLIDALYYLLNMKTTLDIHNRGIMAPFEKVHLRQGQVLEAKLRNEETAQIQATARAELRGMVEAVLARRNACWKPEFHYLSPSQILQVKRLYRQANKFLIEAEGSYGLCPMTPLVHADVLAAAAKVHSSYKKASRYYNKASHP